MDTETVPAPDTDATDHPGPKRDPDVLRARVDLPFPGLECATSALRGHLRAIRDHTSSEGVVRILDWGTLSVQGPDEHRDPDGRSWFTYTATVTTRPLRPLDPPTPAATKPADTGT